jgi:hypothetical protein
LKTKLVKGKSPALQQTPLNKKPDQLIWLFVILLSKQQEREILLFNSKPTIYQD